MLPSSNMVRPCGRSTNFVVFFPTGDYFTVMSQATDNGRGGSGGGSEEGIGPALRWLLRPLIKALIAKGVTAPALYAMLKALYVEVAREEFRLEGEPPTDSRVSVLTGVHRKDVRAFREAPPAIESPLDRRVTVMATVVGRWLADPGTTGKDGRPRPLPRQAGDGPSFDALVESVSTDVRPRTVLDELLRKGVVALDEKGETVSLRAEALLTREGGDERFHFFARNIGDHIAAATENILTEDGPAPFLERAVFYNNLRTASVADIEAKARELAGEALAELNRLGFARQSADAKRADEKSADGESADERFRFGVYFYRENETSKDER